MSKQVAGKANGAGLPASITNMAAALATSAATSGAAGGGELYLKMSKHGEWVYGMENTEVEEGAVLAINPHGFTHGWVAWGSKERGNEGTNVGEVMVPATQPAPLETDLPEVNGDWTQAIGVQMKVTNGEDEDLQLMWKANSLGARKAYAVILQAIVARIGDGSEDIIPLVELEADSYMHTTYGKIFVPEVNIVGWMAMSGEVAEEVAALEEQAEEPETEPEPEPAPRRRGRKAAADADADAEPAKDEKPPRRRRRKAAK